MAEKHSKTQETAEERTQGQEAVSSNFIYNIIDKDLAQDRYGGRV